MRSNMLLPLIGLLIFPALILTPSTQASAQSVTYDVIESEGQPTGTATDLRISPRLGIGYRTSGAGFDGFTRFEGFLPLLQEPGENLTFLDSHFLLDHEGNIGGNILLGHRFYTPERDRIWGGYVGIDTRRTDESNFTQLGLGAESLGRVWDFRINGYLPLGDSQAVVDQSIATGRLTTTSGFQGNLLVLDQRQERRITRTWESALGGFDVEVGAKLARWDTGNLRGYGGLYYLDGVDIDSTWGWRVRLESRPVDNLNLNLSLQADELFGTNLAFSIGLTFPRIRPRGSINQPEEVVARLGEPIDRNPSIAVAARQETQVEVERTTRPLMNPEEERPYRFQHVTLGATGGDGTFERPFGTVEAALGATRSDGNDIVYVDQGSNPEIPAFRIPDRVQVLSQAPVQILAGMPFPGFPRGRVRLPFSPTPNFNEGISVRLPLSGDGNFPLIRETTTGSLVTLGDRTTISGFRIADATENAIVGTNIANVEIRDNQITNAGSRGIFLDSVTDSIVMLDNTVTGTRGRADAGQGIFIRNNMSDSVEVSIANHQLSNNRVGVEIAGLGDPTQRRGALQRVAIDNTTIQSNREQGLLLSSERFGNQIVTFTDGTITNNGGTGIQLFASNAGAQEFTIANSTISLNQGDGIRVFGGTAAGTLTSAQEVFIRENTIDRNTGFGIHLEVSEDGAQEFAIGGNRITNNGTGGIRGVANNVSFQEFVSDASNSSAGINNNVITGNGGQGLELIANDSSTLVADIQNNRLEGNRTSGQPDLEVASRTNTAKVCTVVVNNTSPVGIRLDNNSAGTIQGLFEVGDLSTVASRNTGNLELLPNAASFTNKPGVTSCFR